MNSKSKNNDQVSINENFEQDNAQNLNAPDTSNKFDTDLTQKCKNEPIFDSDSRDNHTTKEADVNPVSENSNQHNSKNCDENTIFSLSEDEKRDFSLLFPGVSFENVQNDPIFKVFARGREFSAPISSIYSDYLELVHEISKEISIKSEIASRNELSSVGELGSSENYNDSFYTKEQVLRMSREQIANNYDKIRLSQQRW